MAESALNKLLGVFRFLISFRVVGSAFVRLDRLLHFFIVYFLTLAVVAFVM